MSRETEHQGTGWTVDTLHEHVQVQLADHTKLLEERYATQVKAVDAAFIAQSTAMRTAFDAADRAVQAALQSAEKAVTKAENAAEKRFESVNEFRAQLADQAQSFLPRAEADVRIEALGDKLDVLTLQLSNMLAARQGGQEQQTIRRADNAQVWQAVGVMTAVLAVLASVLVAVLK